MQWAVAFGDAARAVTKALNTPGPNNHSGELVLERAIEWKFLIAQLLLQKPPSNRGMKASTLKPIV